MTELQTKTSKVWFITGASTGLGRSLAEEIIAAGGKVIATARNIDKVKDLETKHPKQVHAATLDVRDAASIKRAIESGKKAFGRIDVLVNNAGYGLAGTIEDVTEEQVQKQFDTNVFGLLRVTRALLPILREQGSGFILNISSVGGRVAFPVLGMYNATKFAVEAISEALSQEVAPFGINVISVEPGAFRTEFINGADRAEFSDTYAFAYDAVLKMVSEAVHGDPAKAGRAMIHVVESGKAPQKLALGADAYQRIQEKLTSDLEMYKQFEYVSNSTPFDDPAKGKVPMPALV
jgi:NADP-dependent 3-hydroxy acid dehydrogenase YdfG